MNKSDSILRNTSLCIVFAMLTAALAQIEIPLPLVPISGQTLAVGLTATILGSRLGALSMVFYVVAGVLGAPIFTGFDAGLQVLTGLTGGYILGFIAAAFVIGYILEKKGFTIKTAFVANIIGMIVILSFGMVQLKYVMSLSWPSAFASGVYPFLVTGLLKAFLAGWLGITARKKLIQNNVLLKPEADPS